MYNKMERFLFYQTLMLEPMIKSIDFACPDYKESILNYYLTNIYVDQDVPTIWIQILASKLNILWKIPTNDYDYSSESTNED